MKNKYLFIGLAAIAVVLSLLWWMQRKQVRYNWEETYDEKSKQPYGTYIARDILRGYPTTQNLENLPKKIAKALPTEGDTAVHGNYVFIGDGFFVDTADIDKLMLFVYNGGRAFISTNAVPNYLLERLALIICQTLPEEPTEANPNSAQQSPPLNENTEGVENKIETAENTNYQHSLGIYWADTTFLNFTHPKLIEAQSFRLSYYVKNTPQMYAWSYIDTLSADNNCRNKAIADIAPIGLLKDSLVNFMAKPYGKGAIYLHTTPLAFTNIQLLDSTHVSYIEKVWSHLQTGKVFWDTKSRVSRQAIDRMNGSNLKLDRDSPLKYILAQPALRWAWFLFLGLVAAYLIFVAKRRQRIIPVLEKKENTSLQFIQTVGLMYFRQSEHVRICAMKLKQFQTFVHERYHLTARTMDDVFIQTLSMRSGISESDIRHITLFEKRIAYNDITEDVMIEFHNLLNQFYRQCK
jgi:hypothetical protein